MDSEKTIYLVKVVVTFHGGKSIKVFDAVPAEFPREAENLITNAYVFAEEKGLFFTIGAGKVFSPGSIASIFVEAIAALDMSISLNYAKWTEAAELWSNFEKTLLGEEAVCTNKTVS